MGSSIGFSSERQGLAARVERYTSGAQDWVFQLVLVAAIVWAVVDCALSLNGGTIA